jgi:phosphoadenosine phosphosulfate reductase
MQASAARAETPSLPLRAQAERLARAMADASASERLERAIQHEFRGRVALVSSFGAESAPLLHLVAQIDPATPILFLDTGKHFAQTLDYRRELASRLGLLDVRDISPDAATLRIEDERGDLWRRDNDRCCALRKVAPLAQALLPFDAWITGRKRFHGGLRGALPAFEASEDRIKINPLVDWDADDLARYAQAHDLPPHPLVEAGFRSIGCWPCTEPSAASEPARAGRWRGASKDECGIHRIGARARRKKVGTGFLQSRATTQ